MAFSDKLYTERAMAYAVGQDTADANGAPVAILRRDGWLAVCEEPPEDMDVDPLTQGWEMDALIEPSEVNPRERGDDDGIEYADPRDHRESR